jgi:hypothetical protein
MSREKIDAAIKRVTDEANNYHGEHPGSRKFQNFSEILIDACTTDDIADKLLDEEKTMCGADAVIKKAAEKDDGYIDDDVAHGILCDYFGIPNPAALVQATDASDYLDLLL